MYSIDFPLVRVFDCPALVGEYMVVKHGIEWFYEICIPHINDPIPMPGREGPRHIPRDAKVVNVSSITVKLGQYPIPPTGTTQLFELDHHIILPGPFFVVGIATIPGIGTNSNSQWRLSITLIKHKRVIDLLKAEPASQTLPYTDDDPSLKRSKPKKQHYIQSIKRS